MKPEIYALIEAVRDLGIKLTGDPSPRSIRITGDTGAFAEKLRYLQEALEAVDRASSSSVGDEFNSNVNDPAKLKNALDGLLRFIQTRGVNISEVDSIVRDALQIGASEEVQTQKVATLPSFAPSSLKKRKGKFKPRLNIYPERPGEASLNDLKKIVFELGAVESLLGATLAKPTANFERMKSKMGFASPNLKPH